MQTRDIPQLNITTSRLGFGAMRMPEKDRQIDYPRAEALIDYCMQNGITYYDTAWVYHNKQSEPFLRRALVERYPRGRFTLATKLPLGECHSPADMARIFEAQRQKLGVEYIDFYLLHGIDADGWDQFKRLGAPAYLRRLKDEGKIRFGGFSFHDDNAAFAPILDEFPCDFCQIQVNYADWYQRGADELYRAAAERNIPIIIMEPVRGGGLANLYPGMLELLTRHDPEASQTSWAMRFCGALPHADVVLSGMSTLKQCEDNIKTFSALRPLSDAENETLRAIARAFDSIPHIPCTQCRYCDGCPRGIDIPWMFTAMNIHLRYQGRWELSFEYWNNISEAHRASACIQCGQCEAICPQRIGIINELKRVHQKALSLRE